MDDTTKKTIEYIFNDPITKELINDLKNVIDELKYSFTKFNETIKELARRLYEDNICEKDKISQIIKYILIDKINEGKISTRWIEICLPNDFKRKYNRKDIDKTDENSLSNNDQLNNKRESLLLQNSKQAHGENTIEPTGWIEPKLKSKNLDNLASIKLEHNECTLCSDVIAENTELKEAIQKNSKFLSAQILKNEIKIPREKFNDIIAEIKKNNPFLKIEFDIDGNILSIKSDTIMEATTTDIMKNNQGH